MRQLGQYTARMGHAAAAAEGVLAHCVAAMAWRREGRTPRGWDGTRTLARVGGRRRGESELESRQPATQGRPHDRWRAHPCGPAATPGNTDRRPRPQRPEDAPPGT